MTVDEAVAALHAGRRVRMVVGTAAEDPVLVLRVEDRCVVSESVAGWSAGVVEPVCGLDSEFLHEYLSGRESLNDAAAYAAGKGK